MGTVDKLACGCKNHVSTAHRPKLSLMVFSMGSLSFNTLTSTGLLYRADH